VAETISSLTLLMNSLGLRTEWRVIQGIADFFSDLVTQDLILEITAEEQAHDRQFIAFLYE
jgi:hypothetical protein